MPLRLHSIDRQFAHFCRTGDAEALGRVFDAAAAELLHVAAWLSGNRADAEDLLQRTFLTAIEDRAAFADVRRVMPWLMVILTNHARAGKAGRWFVDTKVVNGQGRIRALPPGRWRVVTNRRGLGPAEIEVRSDETVHLDLRLR